MIYNVAVLSLVNKVKDLIAAKGGRINFEVSIPLPQETDWHDDIIAVETNGFIKKQGNGTPISWEYATTTCKFVYDLLVILNTEPKAVFDAKVREIRAKAARERAAERYEAAKLGIEVF